MKPSHISKPKMTGNHRRNILGSIVEVIECVIFLVGLGYKCGV